MTTTCLGPIPGKLRIRHLESTAAEKDAILLLRLATMSVTQKSRDKSRSPPRKYDSQTKVKGYSSSPSRKCDHQTKIRNKSPTLPRKHDRQTRNEDSSQESRQRKLQRDLDDLQRGLRLLPTRKIGECSRGVSDHIVCAFCEAQGAHYSDSCPVYTNEDERFELIMRDGRCQYCLERCADREECKRKSNPCWYCSIVRPTILRFLIPNNEWHHRALCSVPNSKDRIRDAIEDVRSSLEKSSRP
ncbi:unnamed protein product [Heligmosomoides polygyrus]|uniref:BZIP domain-containing protein n=1 Tax=Heligmosomoides polygyrus TaxID=6339 RepID=A0A183G6R9_HELPZ|nr:unnamed protein product [Heligmosomoides polygyrus]